MPFDDTRAVSDADGDFHAAVALTALPFALEAPDPDAKRRAGIQRAVSITAGILCGALGALAGAAVVVMMLVALVIPATMAVALASIADLCAMAVIGVWLKRRTLKMADADPVDPIAIPA